MENIKIKIFESYYYMTIEQEINAFLDNTRGKFVDLKQSVTVYQDHPVQAPSAQQPMTWYKYVYTLIYTHL